MIIEEHFDYSVLKEKVDNEFLEMAEYSVQLYKDGKIIRDEKGDLIIPDHLGIDMVKLDLDAVRWWLGIITVEQYIDSIAEFYKRA
ncbi:MAG: hypothetical protein IJ731_01820 [Eubacterium sp.]|nr:hypothetical protein [Eubacterium sp.]